MLSERQAQQIEQNKQNIEQKTTLYLHSISCETADIPFFYNFVNTNPNAYTKTLSEDDIDLLFTDSEGITIVPAEDILIPGKVWDENNDMTSPFVGQIDMHGGENSGDYYLSIEDMDSAQGAISFLLKDSSEAFIGVVIKDTVTRL